MSERPPRTAGRPSRVRQGRDDGPRSRQRRPRSEERRARRDRRAVGRRQVDAAPHLRPARAAAVGRGRDQRRATSGLERPPAHDAAAHHHRLRLPVPPSAARVHRARERRHAAADCRAGAEGRRDARSTRCSTCLASAPRRSTGRPNSRAASSSASPSRARRPTIRGSILADEPTGNLDPATSDLVFEALASLIRDEGAAGLIATHNHDLARRADRIVTIRNGLIEPLVL